jgi:hypothetical protein
MVGRRTNNRRNAPRAPRGNVRTLVRRAQHNDAGHKIVPALRPPQIVRLPWNSFTFSATYSTESSATITVSIGSIRSQIISQMGLAGAPGTIAIKVDSVYAWNTAVGPNFTQPSMEGLFWELNTDSGGSYSVRSEQYDHGTLNIPARCGYKYPLGDRKEVHTSTNDSHVVSTFTVPSGSLPNGNVTVRAHILWKSQAVPAQANIADAVPANPERVD